MPKEQLVDGSVRETHQINGWYGGKRYENGAVVQDVTEGRKDDADKLRMDLIPFGPLKDIAAVLTFGAKKYAPNNWQFVPEPIPRYEAALLRHFTAYKEGEANDPETGLPHLAHMACCLMFLQWFTREDK